MGGSRSRAAVVRRRLMVRGRVQGVGFRPYVFRLATEVGLGGVVGNSAQGAFIEVEGTAAAVRRFGERLPAEAPALSQITAITIEERAPLGEREFRIEPSKGEGPQEAEITPDAGTCKDCLRELNDPKDRRYRYPFINCTNCGPRYTIVRGVPYDRPLTTMARFDMCQACRKEYEDPADRRFHAQPNACPACGPRAWLAERTGEAVRGEAVLLAAERLRAGLIVAVKGLGGFHLACRADDDKALHRLRERKARDTKPFAVMVASLEAARALGHLDTASTAALQSVARPIVLCPRRDKAAVSDLVAPGSASLGLLLPYTPLHHLLLAEVPVPLVMTSGNPCQEPLAAVNQEALERLGDVADAFLFHDRDIERRVDDSVVVSVKCHGAGSAKPTSRVVPLRRARGYVPASVAVPVVPAQPILALGGDLKAAICVLGPSGAVLSEHLGDLENPAAFRAFMGAVERLTALLKVKPRVVACDLHPAYASTRHARSMRLPVVAVQHHHAHAVACMAEHGLTGRVVALTCDGTGYGTDGAIWGCEVLACDEANADRVGHLAYFPLPGGDGAALDTWRPAHVLARQAWPGAWRRATGTLFDAADQEGLQVAESRLAGGGAGRVPQTSSLGRVFDAAAFLLGLRTRNGHEAEAPQALEAEAVRSTAEALPFEVTGDGKKALLQLSVLPTVRALVEGRLAGRPVKALARGFHEAVAAMLTEAARRAASAHKLDRVVLSGGCFANRVLLASVAERLTDLRLSVYCHAKVPTGDGGLALGQAVVAAARRAKG